MTPGVFVCLVVWEQMRIDELARFCHLLTTHDVYIQLYIYTYEHKDKLLRKCF